MYERALDVARRVPNVTDDERASLWITLGDLRELAGVLDGSIEAYRKATELTHDPVTKAEILTKRVRVHKRAGQSSTALRLVTQARRHLAGVSGGRADQVNASLDNMVALVRLDQEKPREALIWAQRAADEARRGGDIENLGEAHMSMGRAELQLGVVGQGEHFRQALDIFVSIEDLPSEAVARANLAVLRFTAGHWAEAVSLFESSRAAALRAGWHLGAAENDLNIGEILITQGRIDEGEQVVRSAVRVLRASGGGSGVVYGELLLARVALAQGNPLEAEQQASRVVQAFHALGSPMSALEASLLQAQAGTELGRPNDALAIVGEAELAAGAEAIALQAKTQLVRGQALIALGHPDKAGEAIAAGLRAARDQGLPYEEARLLQLRSTLRAQVGAGQEAEVDGARALQILEAIGADQ